MNRAIIHITAIGKNPHTINYSRRMYAILRRYTPEAVEGERNECFAELTGLRTFFKMTYQEIIDKILSDLSSEIGIRFRARLAKNDAMDIWKRRSSKKPKNLSTYKEINKLFIGRSFLEASKRVTRVPRSNTKRIRLTVPFLGKVR